MHLCLYTVPVLGRMEHSPIWKKGQPPGVHIHRKETHVLANSEGLGIRNSGNGLIITSNSIHSLIVLKIFVKLSKWQVPSDGSVNEASESRPGVLGAAAVLQSTLFIDCSLWAESWARSTYFHSLSWQWMSMNREP